jgi:metal iron transporter
MPHALFIGSRLATVDRLNLLPVPAPPPPRAGSLRKWRLPSSDIFGMLPSSWRQARPTGPARDETPGFDDGVKGDSSPSVHELRDRKDPCGPHPASLTLEPESADELDVVDRSPEATDPPLDRSPSPAAEHVDDNDEEVEFNRLDFIRRHITHATVDIVFSLIGFAITINSAILIIAAAAFYKNPDAAEADLFAAHRLIGDYLGSGPALLFAIALLCSGQSASISCTLAGQVVSEGPSPFRPVGRIRIC